MKTLIIVFFIFNSSTVSAQSVTINRSTFGLDKVNNTPDVDKPMSKAVAARMKGTSDSLRAMAILNSQMKISLQIKSDSIRLVYNFLVAQAKDIGLLKSKLQSSQDSIKNLLIPLSRRDTFWTIGAPGGGTKKNPWDFRGIQMEIINMKKQIKDIEAKLP